MRAYHTLIAWMLQPMFWFHPEPDYWAIALEPILQSNVVPRIPG